MKFVRKRDGQLVPFDDSRIKRAIFYALAATGNPDKLLAEQLKEEVVRILETTYGAELIPGIEDIQDVVEKVLMKRGQTEAAKHYILYRKQHQELRDFKELFKTAINLVDNYLEDRDWRIRENSNMSYSLQGLNFHVSSSVIARYWLTKIYPEDAAKAHVRGDIHIHDLGILGPYTYYGKEVVIVKYKGKLMVTSFEDLYGFLPEEEYVLNEKEGAFAKHPEDLWVLDKNGWTKVTRVVRKRKNRPMRFIKNRGGRSVIVTDDHPMITEKGEKHAREVKEEDALYTVNLERLLARENLFKLDKIDLLSEILKRKDNLNEKIYFNGITIEEFEFDEEDGLLHTLTFSAPRFVPLNEDMGYFVGFVLAEGYLSYDEDTPRCISVVQSDQKILIELNERLRKCGFFGCITRKGKFFELRVRNPFLRFLFEEIFGIRPGSRNKSLPREILHYNKEFLKGLIAGILDGDGSIDSNKTTFSIRIASRSLLESLAVILSLLGFTPRDRNIEGQGSIRIYEGREIRQRYPIYGLSFRKLEDIELPSSKYREAKASSRAWHDEGRDEWHRVLNYEETEIPDEYIYDITTESGTLIVNGMWNHNCVGWDLEDLLRRGFGGVPGKISSKPAKHFRTALGQIVNFFYTLQGEAAGAQALSNFDTLLAPFVRYDNLSYKEVKQALQEFLFNVNIPTRVGFQTPFSNLTFDLTVSPLYRDRLVIVGGKERAVKYEEFQHEMDMINRAFIELMMEGDANGRIFTFPIPTYNITEDFDWDNPSLIPLWELTGKYGVPYFSNFVNSDMKPEDARSMCCRLRLDNRELRKRGGGLFGANPLTGSIGVVTINLPRIGYISRTEGEFFHRLTELMEIAKKALETKRKILERFTEKGLYPYSKVYLEPIKKLKGAYWANHFSTIGLIGMNEAVENFLGIPFFSKEGKEFAKRVLNYMREILQEFQEETGNLYNLEATPAEGASYRLAKKDLEYFPDIKIQGTKDKPYYTNSVHLPVQATDDIFEILEFEDDLQVLFTGGTVVHLFIGESIFDPDLVKNLVRKIVTNYRLPYFSITPCFSISPVSGFIPGVHYYDPNPHPKEVIEKYGVVVEMDEEELAKLPQGSYIVIEDEAARTVHQPSLFLGIDLNKSGK